MVRLFVRFFSILLLPLLLLASCQKDDDMSKPDALTQMAADSAQKLNTVSAPGNYLASKGTLTVKFQDSIYSFSAPSDSIAFVNMSIDGKEYYGLTAINKAHTISFGISSVGAPIAEMQNNVAGCQFLLHAPGKTNMEFTLTRNASPQDYGIISLEKYNQDTLLAKGTFHTYLAKDAKKNAPFSIADGSFDLKVK